MNRLYTRRERLNLVAEIVCSSLILVSVTIAAAEVFEWVTGA